MMENPPAFDPVRGLLLDAEQTPQAWYDPPRCACAPGTIVDEDALPDGQRAVIPDQQEVEGGIRHPGEWGTKN